MKKNGFTLVEILIVTAVVGVLLAMIVPNALRAIDSANTRACANNIRTLDSAIQSFFADNRAWPTSVGALCPYLDDAFCDNNDIISNPCPFDQTLTYALQDDNRRINRDDHFTTFPTTHIPRGSDGEDPPGEG